VGGENEWEELSIEMLWNGNVRNEDMCQVNENGDIMAR
jgi:hypothetical protein